ncbi:MAG: serine O-acetyltransferase [Verrucomicrobia bacterium]|jgi:serine O-acetyltransferase|nr:serine O-acetyltransferase [Verrucomicrobiota bacterium]
MDDATAQWAQKLIESYRDEGGVNAGDEPGLPSKPEVASLSLQLMQLLFPGYHGVGPVGKLDLSSLTMDRVKVLAGDLRRAFQAVLSGKDDATATAVVSKLFHELPAIRTVLQTDVEAAYEGDPAARTRHEIILSYPFLEAIAIQRVAHFLYRHDIPLVPRMMTEWAHTQTGIDIHPGASIGSHFFIDHGTGVVIGETCRIGARVKLYHGVTLGARSFAKDDSGRIKKGGKRHPDVEDGVTIYPNATVLGGETSIGRNSTIGGNVFLMHSIPPNSLVYNEEAQVRVVNKATKGDTVDYSI